MTRNNIFSCGFVSEGNMDVCLSSCLIAYVGDGVNRITAAGLTSRHSVHVPESVLTLITEISPHPCLARTLSSFWTADARTLQRTQRWLSSSTVTRAFWETNTHTKKHDTSDHCLKQSLQTQDPTDLQDLGGSFDLYGGFHYLKSCKNLVII